MKWTEINLSSESLPSDGKTLFLGNLLTDIASVSIEHLDVTLCNSSSGNDVNDEDDMVMAILIFQNLLHEMANDTTWWQIYESKKKPMGFGGTNQFLAEIRMLAQSVQSKLIDQEALILEKKVLQVYALHKKDSALAPTSWYSQYQSEVQAQKRATE